MDINYWLVFFVSCVVAFTLTAIVCDVRMMKIPNWLTVTAFTGGLLYHLTLGVIEGGVSGVVNRLGISLAGFLVGFVILFIPWLFGIGGGGDVKLMAALGTWLGLQAVIITYIVGGVFLLIGLMGVLVWSVVNHGFEGTRTKYFRPRTKKKTKEIPTDPNVDMRVKRRLSPYAVSTSLAAWCVMGLLIFAASPASKLWQPRTSAPETAQEDKATQSAAPQQRQHG